MSRLTLSSLSHRSATILLAGFLSTALAAPALAGGDSFERKVVVKEVEYGDLNLSDQKDVARLETRIRSASRSVCGNINRFDLKQLADYRACYEQALADASKKVEYAVAMSRQRKQQNAGMRSLSVNGARSEP